MGINRVVISGNLTRDPELRRTQSGMAIISFGMAVNDRRKNSQTGEWEEYPNFIDCTMFGSYAESMANYLHKGLKVMVDGKLRYSSWEKDGQKRSKVEVIAESLDLPPKQNGQGAANGQYQQQANNYTPQQQNGGYSQSQPSQNGNYGNQYQPQGQPQPQYNASVYDDDIPF